MKKIATWKTQTGKTVTVTAELITSEVINLDGDKIEVKKCEKYLDVSVEGFGSQGSWIEKFNKRIVNGVEVVGKVGKLALTSDQIAIIQNLEKEIESHPLWIAKQAKIAKNKAEIKAFEARRNTSDYCHKCGSYCYGDCESN